MIRLNMAWPETILDVVIAAFWCLVILGMNDSLPWQNHTTIVHHHYHECNEDETDDEQRG